MRTNLLGVLLLFLGVACDGGPRYVFGSADTRHGGGTVRPVSPSFGREKVKSLYERLNSAEFQGQFARYSCGDPVPPVVFTLSLWPQAKYRVRHVLIQPRPEFSPGGRTRCLDFGLNYLLDVEVAALDRGEPVNYHDRDPQTGKELPQQNNAARRPGEPRCDCSKAGSGEEWVTWPPGRG